MPTLNPSDWQEPIDWMDVAAHAIPVAVAVLVVVVWILETLFVNCCACSRRVVRDRG